MCVGSKNGGSTALDKGQLRIVVCSIRYLVLSFPYNYIVTVYSTVIGSVNNISNMHGWAFQSQ